MINDHRLYFYLSYAYEQLELHEEAKKFIKLAKTYMKNPTSYMEKNDICLFYISFSF